MTPGPTNSLSDIAGLRVGNAQDANLKSGTTVVVGDAPFTASVAVMGGAPGTRETDLLAPDKSVAAVDALVLSGGSAFGLDACSGVMDSLRADGRGYAIGPAQIPLVPGAILFDLLNGGNKGWTENPYRALGRAAYANAAASFDIGSVGAGSGALTAMLKGGLGTASLVLPDGSTVAALVAANAVGAVTTPGDRHFYAAPFEMGAEFGGVGPDPRGGLGLSLDSRKTRAMGARANTTIAIVATDAELTKAQCHRVATAAHDGIARACVPAHTPHDGDLVFALTTAARPAADVMLTGHAASLCLARAIARAVYAATPADGDVMPCWSSANADI
ncbi:P1 family peptidase [uncultured Sulfitobacter sp.]|uniref:P1 family peptidase n=1 Tax=uncultured Sulfitobacter sp. TaxID=191468 RepID=UPI00260816B4|nr:P1 family peptidase [uncultured Sulfitobacter sp.]